jgi:hypothetical protein
LGNFELLKLALADGTELTRETVIARLEFLCQNNASFEPEAKFAASHFCEFSGSDFQNLDFLALETILSDPSLVLETEDLLCNFILERSSSDSAYSALFAYLRFEFLSPGAMESFVDFISQSFDQFTLPIWDRVRHRLLLPVGFPEQGSRFSRPLIGSAIISVVPALFSRFTGKTFHLLYRGTRDGFDADAFHRRCDGHAETVTLILTQKGYKFGGYTPLACTSSPRTWVADPSSKSFVFTLSNPHDVGPRIFTLKQPEKAIWSGNGYGAVFPGGHDFQIGSSRTNASANYTIFGSSYTNDTGFGDRTFLAGEFNFSVKEIEVFELLSKP